MKLMKPAWSGVALVAIAAAFVAGCGGSSSSNKATAKAAATTSTVFDAQLKGLSDKLAAVNVPVGGGTTIHFKAGEKPRIAYVGYGLGFDYTVPQYAAAKATARKYGVALDTFDPSGDGQKQVQQLQDVMSSGKYNIVVAYPVSADLTCNLLSKQLPAKNILVVVHNQAACAGDQSTNGVLSTLWDPNTPKGLRLWAKRIVAAQGDKASSQKVVIVTGPNTDTSSNDSVKALKAAFGPAGMKIVSTQRTDYTTPDAQQKTQDALQANPGATMVVSTFPEGTRGTVSALRIAGKSTSVKVYDFGGAQKTVADIKQGLVAGSSPEFPATLARSAVEAAILARDGKSVPRAVFNAGVAGQSDNEVPWVDKSNVNSFRPEF